MVAAQSPPAARILVVDDSLLTRTLLAEELRKVDFLVEAAASVAEALFIVAVHQPDVVIVDIYLDDGPSGVKLARTLRAHPTTKLTFVIAISGHYAPGCLQLALDAGCDRFFVKPCPPELLIETVRDFLSSRAVRASAG